MSYQNSIPLATDNMSVSQGDLQGNFLTLDGAWNVNHVQMNLPAQGKHHFIHIPNGIFGAAFPLVTGGNEVALYAESGNLYFRPASQAVGVLTNDINLTGGTKLSPGWCYLPCGIIMKWGSGSITASNSHSTANATLISGVGIPKITTLILPMVTKRGSNELIVSYVSFDETAHTVTASAFKAFSGSNTATFDYLLLGI